MGKQKKKKLLNSLQKAFATAAKFPTISPDSFKKIFSEFEQRTLDNQESLGYVNGTSEFPLRNNETMPMWGKMAKAEYITQLSGFGRDAMLLAWYHYKRVFSFSKETVDYVTKKFPFQYLTGELDDALYKMSAKPIYLEFPNGISMSEQTLKNDEVAPESTIYGVFIGQFCAVNEEFPTNHFARYTIGIEMTADRQFVWLHNAGNAKIASVVEDSFQNEFQRTILYLVTYLNFLYTKKDAIGTALIPKNRSGVSEYYEVRPTPGNSAIPKKGDPNSVVVAGLCSAFGFLSRENLTKMLVETNASLWAVYQDALSKNSSDNDIVVEAFAKYSSVKMITDWERYRSIYQYSQKALDTAMDNYQDLLLLFGFPFDLLKYFPQNAIVLHNPENNFFVMMALVSYEREKEPKIIMLSPTGDNVVISLCPTNQTLIAALGKVNDELPECLGLLCILYHILTIYKQRALKKMIHDTLTAGNPATMSLVPVLPPQKVQHVPSDNKNEEYDPLAYRYGESIESAPFELFSVTPKTVKRQRDEEKKIRMGWKVTPHVRRPHPHRYWVGHGANKRLIVRWLDSMQIHPEQPAKKATLHKVLPPKA